MSTVIKYGSVVSLTPKKEPTLFAYSDGFMHDQTHLRRLNPNSIQPVHSKDSLNFSNTLFLVLPKVTDSSKNRLISKLNKTFIGEDQQDAQVHHKYENDPSGEVYDKVSKRDSEFKLHIHDQVNQLMNEYKDNIDVVEKQIGIKLTFNSIFQLVHLNSGRLLALTEEQAKVESQNYKLILEDYTSERTQFKALPAYQYQEDDDQLVRGSDVIYIANQVQISNKQAFLHYSMTKKQVQSTKIEINLSLEEKSGWEINLFSEPLDHNKLLKVGDVVCLYHSEADATLSMQRKLRCVDIKSFQEVDLEYWSSRDNVEVITESIDQNDKNDEAGAGAQSMWIVESQNYISGGLINFGQQYRLKNLGTSEYLSVVQVSVTTKIKKTVEYVIGVGVGSKNLSLFDFVDLKNEGEKHIRNGNYVYIRNSDIKNWIDFKLAGKTHQVILKSSKEKTEHAVFKILKASSNEVWTINFLNYFAQMLLKFGIGLQKKQYLTKDSESKKHFERKLLKITQKVNDLSEFVYNRKYNESLDLVYGQLNIVRQRMIRQQNIIDLLIRVLQLLLNKMELEVYQLNHVKGGQEEHIEIDHFGNGFQADQQVGNCDEDLMLVNTKVELANSIYQLLQNSIKNNNLIPYFQLHTKYLTSSIKTIKEIFKDNLHNLYQLASDINIDFDYHAGKEISQDPSKQLKILINLYDGEANEEKNEEVKFKQHEKIVSKPVNLINYMINLIWDDSAQNNEDYLNLLSAICSCQGEKVKIIQENIYKLYKKYNDKFPKLGVETKADDVKQADGTFRLMSKAGQLIMPEDCSSDKPVFQFIVEQLNYFASVAMGRNYLWRKELSAQFEKSFLFRNIWNQAPIDMRYKDLQPCFCKIAMSLYVDQDPLQKKKMNNIFNFFLVDKEENLQVFKGVDGANLQEINTYFTLLDNLIKYLEQLDQNIQKAIIQQVGKIQNLLGYEIVLNTMQMLDLLLRLNLIKILKYNLRDQVEVEQQFSKIIAVLLRIFKFDRMNQNYLQAYESSYQKQVGDRLKKKMESKQIVSFGSMTNLVTSSLSSMSKISLSRKKDESEFDEEGGDSKKRQKNVAEQLTNSILVKGLIKIKNQMNYISYLDPIYITNEIETKLKICDILEYFLEQRQITLIQNAIVFFKYYVIYGSQWREETITKPKNQSNKVHLFNDDEDPKIQIRKKIKKLLDFYLGGLLPNINQTGIDSIDSPKVEESDPFQSLSNLKNIDLSFGKEKPLTKYKNFFEELNIDLEQNLDIEQYLSKFLGDNDYQSDAACSVFPILISTYLQINDESLQKKTISVLIKIFNQRKNFIEKLKETIIVFDQIEQQQLYDLDTNYQKIKVILDKQEIWMSNFKRPHLIDCEEMREVVLTIAQMLPSLKNSQIQQTHRLMKLHLLIIELVFETMPKFVLVILDIQLSEQKKVQLIDFEKSLYAYLSKFVKDNEENQIEVFKYFDQLFLGLQYDVGQIEFLIDLFKNNKFLTINKVDSQLINNFLFLIQSEGRQEIFLDFFLEIIRIQDLYIFDNQLAILNAFLPQELEDTHKKLLYCDDMKESTEIRFYLKDQIYMKNDNIIEKLQQVDFKDSYRDEPFRYHSKLLDLLLQTSLNNATVKTYQVDQEESKVKEYFNISVGKLKRYFKAKYLLEILIQPDNFIYEKQKLQTKQQTITNNQPQFSVQSEQEKKEGFTKLKIKALEFLRLVHLNSERGQEQTSELFNLENEVTAFIEFECAKLEKYNPEKEIHIEQQQDLYIDYLSDQVVSFMICYTNKFFKSEKVDRKDQIAISKFAEKLAFKLLSSLHTVIKTKRQYDIFQQLINIHPGAFLFFTRIEKEYQPVIQKLNDLSIQHHEDYQVQIKDDEPSFLFLEHNQKQNMPMSNEKPQSDQCDESVILLNKSEKEQEIPSKKSWYNLSGITNLVKSEDKNTKLKKIYNKQKVDSEFTQKYQEQWNIFVEEIEQHQKTEIGIKEEKLRLTQGILQIHKLLEPADQKKVQDKPDYKILLKKLIQFISFASKDMNCKNTIIVLLGVLQMFMEEEEGKAKEMIQNEFDQLGMTQTILGVLCERNINFELLIAFLDLANQMLVGGNQQVQQGFFNFMQKNPKSEFIFMTINQVFKRQIEIIEVNSKFKVALRENNKDKISEAKLLRLQIDKKDPDLYERLMNQILTFLQNSVEGHYLDMQNYLRHQINSRSNFDLVNLITELFKTYYYENLCAASFKNVLKCLDTLNELVQGPCPQNQMAVAESKFFDIASDLFKKERSPEENQEFPRWMLSRLQNKVLNLIISLNERREINDKNPVLKRIMRNLSVDLMEKHLIKSHQSFVRLYRNDYCIESLEHMLKDPENEQENNMDYYEFILQNGFLIFFLVQYYLECDPTIETPISQMNKNYKKKMLKGKSNLGFIMDTLFGQIYLFVKSIIDSFLDIALDAKNKIQKIAPIAQTTDKNELKNQNEEQRKELQNAYNFFIENCTHIEVLHDGELETVYFILLPQSKYIPKEKKLKFHNEVDRSNTKSKVQGLIEEADNFIEIAEHEEKLRVFFKKNKLIALFTNYVQLWRDIAYFSSIILNIFIIGSFNDSGHSRVWGYQFFQKSSYSHAETVSVFNVLGTIQTCCSIFVVSYYILKNAPLIIKRSWRQKTFLEGNNKGLLLWLIELLFKLIVLILDLLQEIELIYFIAFGVLSLMGILIHPFFFAFHLTEIIIRYPTLKNIILSIWEPRIMLTLSFYLLLVMCYYSAIIAYIFYQETMQGICNTVLYCFLYCLDQTIKGSIGAGMNDGYGYDRIAEQFGFGFWFFNQYTNILLSIVMLGVIGGIIIDTFKKLRHEEDDKNEDIKNKCFICGNEKQIFDRKQSQKSGGGYLEHIKLNHYMWDYLSFLSYIRWKDPTEFSGIESYVDSKLKDDDLSWIPFNQAKELVDDLNNNEGEEEVSIKEIEDEFNEISLMVLEIQRTVKMNEE